MAKDFRSEILADLIRESAQDVIDMADDIAAAADDYLSDFDIWMRFPPDEIPTIEISSSIKSKRCCEILKNILTSRVRIMYSIHIEFEDGSNPYVRYNMTPNEYKEEFRKWSEKYNLVKLHKLGSIIFYTAKEKTEE